MDSNGTVHHRWLEETVVTELLEKARAGEDSRADLKRELEWARRFYYDLIPAKPISAKAYEKVERAAGRLLAALNELDQQLPAPSSLAAVSSFLVSVDPKLLELLFDLRRRAAKSGKVPAKRGQPEKLRELQVVDVAAHFFRTHSPVKPTTDEKNSFRHFAEQFFSAATGLETAEGSLDWQIRHVLKANRRG